MNYGGPYPFGPHPPPPVQGPYSFHPTHGPGYPHPPFPPSLAPFPGPPPGLSINAQSGAFQQHPQWPGGGVPPISFQQGRDGWYYPVNWPQASPNQQIASQPLPPPNLNAMPPQPTPPETPPKIGTPPEIQVDLPEINDYWKGKIVTGLHGSSTTKRYVTLSVQRPIPITKPSDEQKDTKPNLKLLPPRSYPPPPDPNSDHDFPPLSANAKSPNQLPPSPHSLNATQAFHFDRYADVFIPQWLRDIQNQPQTLQHLPASPAFPPAGYIRTFLLPGLIDELCKPRASNLLTSPPPPLGSVPPLAIETYDAHWSALLGWELDKLANDKAALVLWKKPIKILNWNRSEFVLEVPGLRENYPRLEIGDLAHLRMIFEDAKTGSGRAFEARVNALRKREGLVHLYCPALKLHIQQFIKPTHSTESDRGLFVFSGEDELPLSFNISFMMNARPSLMMQAATSTVVDAFFSKPFVNSFFTGQALRGTVGVGTKWLFPQPKDVEGELAIRNGEITEHEWFDTGLNKEQRSAVSSIAQHQSPVPYLINGPAGTGKTRTVVETVLQILRVRPEACILLCAPSNPATDTLVLRLRNNLKPNEMLRLNDQNRTFAEVPNTIIQYCYIENDSFALPPWETLMRYRVVVCSCLDANILVAAQCTNGSLARLEREIMTSLHPHRKPEMIPPHWTHLLIDEAAQGSEPELLIPISVVSNTLQGEPSLTSDSNVLLAPQLVLCGDPNQLGPIVTSEAARSAELDVSLLERLFERQLYAEYPQARSMIFANPPGRHTSNFIPFTNLVKNYRSHPVILMPPSAIFYDDSLEPCAQIGSVSWSGLPNPQLPLVFIGNSSEEQSVDERASWFNDGEIDKVVDTISSLLSEGGTCTPPLRAADIGVMAPWRGQVWKIRESLRKKSLSRVDVGTVEDFQGRESRVIVISCVRSRPRFLKEDATKGLGLVFERKRMNVAITRAMELLVVIGNGALLQRDPYWKAFLQFTLRNKLYTGPKLNIESDGNYISRLESNYFSATVKDEDLEEQGTLMAAGIAREVLRE